MAALTSRSYILKRIILLLVLLIVALSGCAKNVLPDVITTPHESSSAEITAAASATMSVTTTATAPSQEPPRAHVYFHYDALDEFEDMLRGVISGDCLGTEAEYLGGLSFYIMPANELPDYIRFGITMNEWYISFHYFFTETSLVDEYNEFPFAVFTWRYPQVLEQTESERITSRYVLDRLPEQHHTAAMRHPYFKYLDWTVLSNAHYFEFLYEGYIIEVVAPDYWTLEQIMPCLEMKIVIP